MADLTTWPPRALEALADRDRCRALGARAIAAPADLDLDSLDDVFFSPDSRRALLVWASGAALFDLERGALIRELSARIEVHAAAFSASGDCHVFDWVNACLWIDRADGRLEERRLPELDPELDVLSFDVSRDGRQWVVSSAVEGAEVSVVMVFGAEGPATITRQPGEVRASFSPDGAVLLSSEAATWRLGEPVLAGLRSVGFSPAGARLEVRERVRVPRPARRATPRADLPARSTFEVRADAVRLATFGREPAMVAASREGAVAVVVPSWRPPSPDEPEMDTLVIRRREGARWRARTDGALARGFQVYRAAAAERGVWLLADLSPFVWSSSRVTALVFVPWAQGTGAPDSFVLALAFTAERNERSRARRDYSDVLGGDDPVVTDAVTHRSVPVLVHPLGLCWPLGAVEPRVSAGLDARLRDRAPFEAALAGRPWSATGETAAALDDLHRRVTLIAGARSRGRRHVGFVELCGAAVGLTHHLPFVLASATVRRGRRGEVTQAGVMEALARLRALAPEAADAELDAACAALEAARQGRIGRVRVRRGAVVRRRQWVVRHEHRAQLPEGSGAGSDGRDEGAASPAAAGGFGIVRVLLVAAVVVLLLAVVLSRC